MPVATLEDLLENLSDQHRAEFIEGYRALRELPKARCDLQSFFDEYLDQLVNLYAATAGVLWFCGPDPSQLVAKSRVNFERIGLTGELADCHDKLLAYALTRSKSFLVKPFSAPARQSGVSNPTDSFLVLGPVDHHGKRIAVVELFLGPTPLRGKSAGERNRYLLWLDHLVSFLCQGVELRLLRTAAPLHTAVDVLAAAQNEMDSIQASIRSTLERHVNVFVGWNFGSLEKNQSFATRLHELLDQYGLRVECIQCGAPAILRCQNSGNSKAGVFLFDHYLETGRTFHGGPTTIPSIRLVPKPARRKSS